MDTLNEACICGRVACESRSLVEERRCLYEPSILLDNTPYTSASVRASILSEIQVTVTERSNK